MDSDAMNSGVTKSRSPAHLALPLIVCAVWLAGCASDPAPVEDLSLGAEAPARRAPDNMPRSSLAAAGSYRVVRGDTLYSIAFKRGLDYRDVAAWNDIAPPYKILVGQDLRLSPGPSAVRAAVPVASNPPAQSAPPPIVVPVNPPAPAAVASAPPAQNSAATSGGIFEDVPSESSAPPLAAVPPPAPVVSTPPPAASPPTPAPLAAVAPTTSPPVASGPPPTPKPAAEEVVPLAKPTNEGATASVSGIIWRWPSSGKAIGGFVGGDQTKQGIDIAGSSGDPVLAAADGDVVYSGNGLLGYGELIIVKHNANFLSAYGHNRKRLVQEGDKVRSGQQIAEMGSSASSRDELHFEIRKNGKPVNPLDYLPAR